MAIKGYLSETGMGKVRSFINTAGGFRYAIMGTEVFQPIELFWNVPANQNFIETTNSIANNNEILFRIGSGITMGNLLLHFNTTVNSPLGIFHLEGVGQVVNSDTVILYNKIRFTFAYKTESI